MGRLGLGTVVYGCLRQPARGLAIGLLLAGCAGVPGNKEWVRAPNGLVPTPAQFQADDAICRDVVMTRYSFTAGASGAVFAYDGCMYGRGYTQRSPQ